MQYQCMLSRSYVEFEICWSSKRAQLSPSPSDKETNPLHFTVKLVNLRKMSKDWVPSHPKDVLFPAVVS